MRVWSAESPHPMADPCTYRNGKLVKGNPNTCPEPKFLITKSLPAGCTAKIAQSVERDGITAPWPPGCQYE
jgi:hypothetical protein